MVEGDHPHRPRQPDSSLHKLERIVAGLIGLLTESVGGVAIFVSSNQAASSAILLIGAAFLLIAVQGTPLIELGKDSIRVADRVAQVASEELEEKGPDAANKVLSGAITTNPELASEAAVLRVRSAIDNWFSYNLAVSEALSRAGDARYQVVAAGGSDAWDLRLSRLDGQVVAYIDTKFSTREANSMTVQMWVDAKSRAGVFDRPFLTVTNMLPPRGVAAGGPVIVTWRNEGDDERLREGLNYALDSGRYPLTATDPSPWSPQSKQPPV